MCNRSVNCGRRSLDVTDPLLSLCNDSLRATIRDRQGQSYCAKLLCNTRHSSRISTTKTVDSLAGITHGNHAGSRLHQSLQHKTLSVRDILRLVNKNPVKLTKLKTLLNGEIDHIVKVNDRLQSV